MQHRPRHTQWNDLAASATRRVAQQASERSRLCALRVAYERLLAFITSGRLKRVPLETVPGFACEAWATIPSAMVERSFKKCGIANALDGTEDEMTSAKRNSLRATRSEITSGNKSPDSLAFVFLDQKVPCALQSKVQVFWVFFYMENQVRVRIG